MDAWIQWEAELCTDLMGVIGGLSVHERWGTEAVLQGLAQQGVAAVTWVSHNTASRWGKRERERERETETETDSCNDSNNICMLSE